VAVGERRLHPEHGRPRSATSPKASLGLGYSTRDASKLHPQWPPPPLPYSHVTAPSRAASLLVNPATTTATATIAIIQLRSSHSEAPRAACAASTLLVLHVCQCRLQRQQRRPS
jgi:hypothetical protein